MSPTSTTEPGTAQPRLWRNLLAVSASVPVLTLLLLILIDVLLRLGNPVDALGYRSVDLWAMSPKLNICRRTNPDLAIIGSSLLLTLNLTGDQTHSFYSRLYPPYLQAVLRRLTGEAITCINMCTGSQVVSESYLITQAFANQRDYPAVIIYGITVRDLMHNQFARETSCDCFDALAPYVPVNQQVLGLMTGDDVRGDFLLSHYWYLFRNRNDFKNLMAALTKNWLEHLPLDASFERVSPQRWFCAQPEGWLWEEWVPRRQLSSVFKEHPEYILNFYFHMHKDVYSQGSPVTREIEGRYLENLAALCKQKGIILILVNMPLGQQIMRLAPPGLNEAFSTYLRGLAANYDAELIDFFGNADFAPEDFSDWVHLNAKGAKIFADKLVTILQSRSPRVLQSLSRHAALRILDPQLKARQEEPYNKDMEL